MKINATASTREALMGSVKEQIERGFADELLAEKLTECVQGTLDRLADAMHHECYEIEADLSIFIRTFTRAT